MKRKRNDYVHPGRGIDGTEGENYTKEHAFNDVKFGYVGDDRGERSKPGKYTDNDSGLTRIDKDFQFSASSRDIFDDVMENDRPGGNFDSTGPIRAGVNKKQ